MKVIEYKVQGKGEALACEDGLVMTPCHCAVIDGSTSKSPRSVHPTVRNGRYCMQLVSRAIEQLPPQATLDEMIDRLTETVSAEYRLRGLSVERLRQHPEERLTCSVAVYSSCHRQLWMIGDCQARVNGTVYSVRDPQEEVLARKRAQFIAKALAEGAPAEVFREASDPGRAVILPDLIAKTRRQNQTYAVIDGFPVYRPGVRVLTLPVATEVVLATDGYPRLLPTLAETEEYLQQMLQADSLCIHWHPATKGVYGRQVSFDDRAYLRFSTD
ncbi:MAG: hypothetical protein ACI3YD_04695 [Alloprevotella sp.]